VHILFKTDENTSRLEPNQALITLVTLILHFTWGFEINLVVDFPT